MKDRKAVFWVFKKIYRRIPALLLMSAVTAVNAVLGVLFALGSRNIIDGAVSGDRQVFYAACFRQLCIIVGMILCLALSRYLRDKLVTELDRDWKKNLLHKLLHADYMQASSYHSGELINRLNNDVRILDDGLVSAIPSLVSMVVRLGAAVFVLVLVAPALALAMILVGVAVIIGTGIARRGLKELNKQVSSADGCALSFLQEVLERLLIVQAMDLSDEVERRSDGLLKERLQLQRRRRRASLAANTGVGVVYYLMGFLTLVWCSNRMLMGAMSFGTLTAVIQLVSQIQTPFINLSGFLPQYAAMLAAAERLMEVDRISQSEKLDARADVLRRYQKLDGIGAQDLCFSYDDEEIFQGASFYVPKGSFVVITGESGIGKSTLLKLILGIFRAEKGSFYLQQGEVLTELSRSAAKMFAYVPQGNFLFSGTVRENILISNPETTAEELCDAVYFSGTDQFLSQLPEGLDSVIGEGGEGLSEGQAQRISIARAVLSQAPVLLLDEATSALDGQTEHLVLERIAGLKDRTCLVVTHRPAALEFAHVQLEVENKKIHVCDKKA